MDSDQFLRNWLKINGYEDILELINATMIEWKRLGIKTRRNWWDILAGDKFGRPRKILGKEFPVLRAAQIRKGVQVTPNALCINENEQVPAIVESNRWPKIK